MKKWRDLEKKEAERKVCEIGSLFFCAVCVTVLSNRLFPVKFTSRQVNNFGNRKLMEILKPFFEYKKKKKTPNEFR